MYVSIINLQPRSNTGIFYIWKYLDFYKRSGFHMSNGKLLQYENNVSFNNLYKLRFFVIFLHHPWPIWAYHTHSMHLYKPSLVPVIIQKSGLTLAQVLASCLMASPEPKFTYHHKCSVACTWQQFHKWHERNPYICSEITLIKLPPYPPRARYS